MILTADLDQPLDDDLMSFVNLMAKRLPTQIIAQERGFKRLA